MFNLKRVLKKIGPPILILPAPELPTPLPPPLPEPIPYVQPAPQREIEAMGRFIDKDKPQSLAETFPTDKVPFGSEVPNVEKEREVKQLYEDAYFAKGDHRSKVIAQKMLDVLADGTKTIGDYMDEIKTLSALSLKVDEQNAVDAYNEAIGAKFSVPTEHTIREVHDLMNLPITPDMDPELRNLIIDLQAIGTIDFSPNGNTEADQEILNRVTIINSRLYNRLNPGDEQNRKPEPRFTNGSITQQ